MSQAPQVASPEAAAPFAASTGVSNTDRPIMPPEPGASSRPVLAAPTRSIGRFHPIPVIGHPESFYLKHAKEAEAAGDTHARASHKVGQYVTTALTPGLAWDEKLRRFRHALEKYCATPTHADDSLCAFYKKLMDIVRRYAGQEAVHIAKRHHDAWMTRLKAGEPREDLEDEAEVFFFDLLGHGQCPEWCCRDAYLQIIGWRDYWV